MTTRESSRAFARVDLRIPARVRVISNEEARELARRLTLEPSYSEKLALESPQRGSSPSWERLALFDVRERLDRLERLLETMAASMGLETSPDDRWFEGDAVSLSGSGAGLWLPRRLEENTPVELELTLLGEPTAVVRLIAHIVTLVRPDGEKLPVGRFHLGVAFDAWHDEDLQAVIRYTFARQRAQIREMRAEGDPE